MSSLLISVSGFTLFNSGCSLGSSEGFVSETDLGSSILAISGWIFRF